MRKVYFLILLCCLGKFSFAQTAACYTFSTSSTSFSSISGSGTSVSSLLGDDNTYSSISIGFNFSYCGVTYNQLSASSNGWLSLANTSTSGYPTWVNTTSSFSSMSGGVGLLMPLWDDLYGRSGSGAGAYYTTTGSSPNRKFIFEWTNWGWVSGSSSRYGSIQVILYETSNKIDYVYSNTSSLSVSTATIGIANSTSDYQTLTDMSSAPSTTTTTFYDALSGFPSTGQVYTFSPPSPCSGTPTAGSATSSLGTACASSSFTLSIAGASCVTGLTYQWYSSPDGSSWTAISGATDAISSVTESSATYFHCVVTCSASSASATSTSVYVPYISVCYCTPSYYYASSSCSYGYTISSFEVNGDSSTSISDYASCDGSGYLDRTSLTPVKFMQGSTYTAYVSTGSTCNTQAWIDFDDDGTFASSESVGGLNYFYSSSYSITIPVTARTGFHRMREVLHAAYWGYDYPSMDPCAYGYYYGEVRDYTVKIISLPACTSAPSAGTSRSSVGTACPSLSFTLSVSGFSVAGGLGFQWESSPDSATWTPITGATDVTYTTTESASRYYRCKVTCTSISASNNSTPVYVPYIGVCYCTPNFYYAASSCSYGYVIQDYEVVGESSTSISDAASCDGSGYLDRTSLSVNLMQGRSYGATLMEGYITCSTETWIDFNDDGNFDAADSVGGYGSFYYIANYNINIPITAPTGRHRMRVALSYYYSGAQYPNMDPCIAYSYYYGEVRDYTANIVTAPPCSGTPTAGTASATVYTACSTSPLVINLTGYTSAGSITYQWQRAASATGPWTNISGATAIPFNATVSSAGYYRCYVTCTASSSSDSSNVVFVNYSTACYCTPTFYYNTTSCSSYNFAIGRVQSVGDSSTMLNDSNACAGTGYQDRTMLSVSYMQGSSYVVTVTTNVGSSSTAYTLNNQIWIDFDDDGTFASSETVGGLNGYSGLPAVGVDNISIPLTAPTGNHRMRVVQIYYGYGPSYPSISPCPNGSYPYYYGEARDYNAHIITPPPCSGTPSAGSVVSSIGTACPSLAFSLTSTGYTTASGLSFIWQYSADSTTWSDISGATSTSISLSESAATYFRLKVTCSFSSTTAYSNVIYVPYISVCYCTPSFVYASTSCTYPFALGRVFSDGESSTRLADSAGCTGTGYQDRTALSAVSYMQGATYNVSVTSSVGSYSYSVSDQIWIDFNDNSTFESTEVVGGIASYTGSTASAVESITMPYGAPTGIHRMRIVHVYTGMGVTYPSIDPCPYGSYPYYYGEARDYNIRIVPMPPCSGTPTAGSAYSATGTLCGSGSATVTLTGYTVASSISFQWQSSTDGSTWSNISGATSLSYSTTLSAPTYFRCSVTCSISSSTAYSSSIFIDYSSVCYCSATYAFGSSSCSTYNFSIGSVLSDGALSTSLRDTAHCDGSTYLDRTRLSVTYMQGVSYNATVSSNVGTYTSGYTVTNQVWIDFNNNGTFESSESVSGNAGYSGLPAVSNQIVVIPTSADTGYHRMRITQAYSAYGTYPYLDPCPTGSYPYYYGETRDYKARIVPMPPCSGRPTAGVAISTTHFACPSMTFGLSLTGTTVATGLTYQWQISIDSTTWTSISGATASTYSGTETAAKYYRCVVGCTSASAYDTSNKVYIAYMTACYCTPSYYYTVCSWATIQRFQVNGEGGTSINDRTAPCGTSGYSGYEANTSMVVNLSQGNSYTPTIGFGSSYYSWNYSDVQTWIDFNDNGTFESTESVGGYSYGYGTPYSFSMAIPSGATLGYHTMRLVYLYTYYSYSGSYPTLDPCTYGYDYGEARDYTVNILPPSCTGSVSAGSISAGTLSSCSGFTTTITASGYTATTGVIYQWQSSTDGSTWTNISGATGTTYSASVTSGSTYFRMFDSCTTSGTSAVTSSVTLTVNTVPSVAAITASTDSVCVGATVSLSNTTSGGTWSMTNTNASISTSGVVTGAAAGNDTAVYAVTNVCGTTRVYYPMRVLPLPNTGTILGASSVCYGATSAYTNVATGGTWSSSNTTVATITSSGTLSAASVGNTVLSYSVTNSCGTLAATRTVNVITVPAVGSITGSSTVCVSATTTLSDTTSGGIWSATNSNASVSSTGVVTGAVTGVDTINYSVTNTCGTTVVSKIITINPLPVAGSISGLSAVCSGSSISLSETVSGGTWSVSNTVATVSTGGSVTGLTSGLDTVIYSVTNSCGTATATHVVSVGPAPNAGTIGGSTSVCVGSRIVLTQTVPVSSGVWTMSNGNAVNFTDTIVGSAAGRDTVLFTVTNSCGSRTATYPITVNPLPDAGTISGTGPFCVGHTVTMSETATGGTWHMSNSHATVSSAGGVTGVSGGYDTLTYSVTNVCGTDIDTFILFVTPTPTASSITGVVEVCEAATITLHEPDTTGVWSVTNANAVISDGVVTGVSAGRDTAIYAVTNACGTATARFPFTVLPLPHAGTITLTDSAICSGTTTTMIDTVSGAVWSSSAWGTARVSAFGVVTGITGGSVIISVTVTNVCGTDITSVPFTILQTPDAGTIYGPTSVCVGTDIVMGDSTATSTGVWSSSDPGIATVDPATGHVTGVASGSVTIYYTVSSVHCGTAVSSYYINVLPLPHAGTITGSRFVCVGSTRSLGVTGAFGTGFWSSGSPSIATVTTGTGIVTGVSAGYATIYYRAVTACGADTTTILMEVDPVPVGGTISGATSLCEASSVTLNHVTGTTTGYWSSSDTSIAVVDSFTGIVTGRSGGTVTISFNVTTAHCGGAYSLHAMTIRPLPNPGTITGVDSVCPGVTVSLASTGTSGGTWSTRTGNVRITSTGSMTGVNIGYDTVYYSVTNTCGTRTAMLPVRVKARPSAGRIVGASTVCRGSSITLVDTTAGGTWASSNASILTVSGGVVTGLSMGSAIIYYSVSSVCGTATASDSITVLSPLYAGISITATPSTHVCTGDYVAFHANPVNGGSTPQYVWRVNRVLYSTDSVIGFIPSNNDSVTLQMVSNAACVINDTVRTPATVITVNPIVVPSITVTSSTVGTVGVGTVVNYTTSITGGGSAPTYQWFVNGAPVAGATNATFSTSVSVRTCVSCVLYSSAPCAQYSSMGSNQICLEVDYSGVNNVNKGTFSMTLFPNPNSGQFTLSGMLNSGSGDDLSYEVVDMTGKVVYTGRAAVVNGLVHQDISLDDKIVPGQYIMKVLMADGTEYIHFSILK